MPKYRIQTPDGKTLLYDVPAGVTAAQALAHAQQTYGAKPTVPVSTRQQGVQQAARTAIATKAPTTSTVGAIFRGLRDAIPGVSYLDAGANYLGTKLGLNATDPNMSYADRVRAIQANNEQAENIDRQQHPIAHYGAEAAGLIGSTLAGGALTKAAGAGLAASSAPKVAQVGNVLQKVATLQKGQKLANAGKLALQGGVQGAAYGAGNADPSDIARAAARGAGEGAIAAPLIGGAAGVAGKAVSNIVRRSAPTISNTLQNIVTENPEAIASRAAGISAQTGSPTPVIAALNPVDFANVTDRVLKNSPEALATAKGRTGQYVRGFMDRMLSHVNNAGDQATINGQGVPGGALNTSIGDLDQMRADTMQNMMDPIRNRQVDLTQLPLSDVERQVALQMGNRTSGDLGQRLHQALGGDVDPDVRRLLSQWGMGAEPVPATVGEMDSLRRALSSAGNASQASNPINSAAFNNAARTIRDFVSGQHPEYGNAVDTYAGNSRMLEGFKACAAGKTPDQIEDTLLRNNLNTREGRLGLQAGQMYNLRQAATNTPASAMGLARNLASEGALTRPASIAPGAAPAGTVTQNIGEPAARGLANAAQGETTVLGRMLDTDRVNQAATSEGEGALSPSDLVHAAFLSHALPMTKANFISKIINKVNGSINPTVASNIADKLYSNNPADIDTAMRALQRVGLTQQTVTGIMGDSVPRQIAGAAGSAAIQNTQSAPVAPTDIPPSPQIPGEAPEATPADTLVAPPGSAPDPNGYPAGVDPATGPVDPDASPYMKPLADIYQNENPDFLDFVERAQKQESGGKQFDPKTGKPLTSKAGAVGLMQLEPSTAADTAKAIGVPYSDAALQNDPTFNKLLGVHTLANLLTKYGGDTAKAAAAYNAGPGAVDKALSDNPNNWLTALPAETQNYVKAVS